MDGDSLGPANYGKTMAKIAREEHEENSQKAEKKNVLSRRRK